MSHNMTPILILPTTYEDLHAVLAGIQAYRISHETDLAEFKDQFVEILKLNPLSSPRRDAERKKFLPESPGLLAKMEPPQTIAFEVLEEMKKKYEEGVIELENSSEENDELKRQVEALKKPKDREQVKQAERGFGTEREKFSELRESAKRLATHLPPVVVEAIYHHSTGLSGVPEGEQLWDDIRSAQQDGFLEIAYADEVRVNQEDPEVDRHIDAVDRVRAFLQIGNAGDSAS